MKLLAIDTSSNACSVALQVENDVIEKHVVEPRAHTRILVPMISQLLADGGVALSELDAIVLGNGPGSFIGMRIGSSVVQGMCFGAGILVVPVSSLAAVAVEAFAEYPCEHVVVAQDAHMNEVYIGRFKKDGNGLPVPHGDESIVPVGEIPATAPTYAAAGAAWELYPELLKANDRNIDTLLPILVPRAKHLLAPGRHALDKGGAISPDALIPAYLRNKVAEKPVSAP